MTCRRLNLYWNSAVGRTLKKRSAENRPIVKLINSDQLASHLKFLENRKPIGWYRAYKFDMFMDVFSSTIPGFIIDGLKLIDLYNQNVVSIDLKYKHMYDQRLDVLLNNSGFVRLISGLKEIRFAVAHLYHKDLQYLIEILNKIPNLTRLAFCYSGMYMERVPDEQCDYYSKSLNQVNCVSKLTHLTVCVNYLKFNFIENLTMMANLKFLKIFIQGEPPAFVPGLFEYLRTKCPALKELYLIRLGALKSWCSTENDFPDNEAEWLRINLQLENEFNQIKIVVEKRY